MRNYRKNNRKRLGFEALEQRKLLAGDFASGIVAAIDVGIVEEVEVQAAEVSSLEIEEVDQALQELLADESSNGTEIELGQDLANQTGSADETSLIDTAPVAAGTENLDPRNLDLTDSMDGFFGSISPESPTETLNFTAAADGLANIVISNSFEESDLLLTATSAEGSEIEFELLSNDGFDSISFEVNQGEAYQLTVSSAQPDAAGQFQLTVGFEEFVDQHADQVGSESTELVWADNQTELTGKLEASGDVDTFRATAPQSGEVTLELDELEEDERLNLNVTVTDSNGEVLAEGSTNEFLRITFDATESEEFFVAVSGGQGQRGDYRFSLNLDPAATVVQDVAVVDDVVTESPDSDADPVEDVVAEATDDVAAEDNVAVDADDVASELDEIITGDSGDDELESEISDDVAADATLIDDEPTGELVDEEVQAVVDQVEDVIAEVSDDASVIVEVIGEEVSEVETISEIEEVLDEVSDDVSAVVDVIGEEISEVESVSEIEEVLDEVSDDVSAIVDVIGEELSEVEAISEIEEALDEVSDDVSAIVDEIEEEVLEIDGISEIVDEVEEILEDGLADAPVDEIEEAVDQVVDELAGLFGHEAEVEEVVDQTADQVAEDSIPTDNVADVDVDASEVNAIENVDNVEAEIAQAEQVAETPVGDLAGDIVVAPSEDATQADSTSDTEDETVDLVNTDNDDGLTGDENAETEVEEDDVREFVWSFRSDAADSFFESLSEARDEFHHEHRRGFGFGGWGRRFFRALLRG